MNKIENVQEIMKQYEDNTKIIEEKYAENKELIEAETEVRRAENELAKLKKELEELNVTDMDNVEMNIAIGTYKETIKEAEKKKDEAVNSRNNILLEQNKNKAEKEKNKSAELLDNESKTRQQLTQTKMALEKEFRSIKEMMTTNLNEQENFKYEYEEKDGVKIPTNGESFKKLIDEYDELVKQSREINEAIEYCEESLNKFIEKDNERVAKINEILKEGKIVPQEQPRQAQPGQAQQGEAQQGQAQQGQAQQGQAQSATITLDIKNNKIYINGKDQEIFYKVEGNRRNVKELKKEFYIDERFKEDRKAKRNIDYALVSVLKKIDNKNKTSLVMDYLNIIQGKSFDHKDLDKSFEDFQKTVNVEYKFDKYAGFLTDLGIKRIARNAKKIGIASLEGISEKGFFETISEKLSKAKDMLPGMKKQQALESGEQKNTQKGKENLKDRKDIKVKNKNNELERNAQAAMQQEADKGEGQSTREEETK